MKYVYGLVIALLWGTAFGQARWDERKGDCEDVFKAWRTHGVDKLRDCVMAWEMYRDATRVDSDQKAVVHEAFDKLYRDGDKRDAVMALSAMKRLGLRPRELRDETRAVPKGPAREQVEVVEPVREQQPMSFEPGQDEELADEFRPAEPQEIDHAAAERAYAQGRSYEAKGKYAEAVSEFLIAADADPTWAPPLYLAARCYTRMKRYRPAVQMLQRMKAINSDLSLQLVTKAVKDPAFKSLRRIDAFKDLAGIATVQLLNGAGEKGLETVKKYYDVLAENGIPVASVAQDRNPRKSSWIYTKPGYEAQGERIRRLLRLGLVHKRVISWPSQYDIMIVHGMQGKSTWIDDEAEKAAANPDADKEKKKKEAEAKKKAEEAEKQAKMKEQVQMMKMMQQMNADDAASGAATANDPSGGALPPP